MDGYQNYLVNDKDELKRLYENKVIEYENVDDVYASKVDFWYYSKYTSFGEGFLDKLEWIGGALKSFGEGICGGVVDVVKGIGTLLWEIGEFAISGITCLVFTGVGCEPPEWASKNINETVDTVKLIMDDPIVILEGIGQGVSDAYEKEGICYCAGYAIGSYVGTKGITKATKVVTGKIKGIRANKELPKVEIENTLDELDEFEKFYDDIYDAQRELNPEYEEFLDDLTKAPDDGIVIESGTGTRDIYRAVSPEELDDIFATGGFRARLDGRSFQAKEFGNSFDETLDFANKPINLDKVAIVKVTIPENVYNQLHHMNLDRAIFKSGTPVVEPEMLDMFNESIISIEHAF